METKSDTGWRAGPEDAIPHIVSILGGVEGSLLFVTCIDADGQVGESECFASANQSLARLPLEHVFHFPKQQGAAAVMFASRSNEDGRDPTDDIDLAQELILEGKLHGITVYDHVVVQSKDSYVRLREETDLWN